MRSRLLVTAGLAALGALFVLLATSQRWGSLTVTTQGAHQHATVTGRQVSPALSAVAIALLAVAVATVAARGLLRRVVAVIGVAVAVVEVVLAFRSRNELGAALAARVIGVSAKLLPAHASSWWTLAALGGIVAAIAFLTIAVAGGRWLGMGARYDAPQAPARQKDPAVAAWEALDRGDDPTAGPA